MAIYPAYGSGYYDLYFDDVYFDTPLPGVSKQKRLLRLIKEMVRAWDQHQTMRRRKVSRISFLYRGSRRNFLSLLRRLSEELVSRDEPFTYHPAIHRATLVALEYVRDGTLTNMPSLRRMFSATRRRPTR